MKKLLTGIAIAAFLAAGMAKASVNYTNDSDVDQTVTVGKHVHYSYYGFGVTDEDSTSTVTLAPGETAEFDDYVTTWGDGGDYSELYDLVSVE